MRLGKAQTPTGALSFSGQYSEAPNSLGARHASKPGTAPRPRFCSHSSDAAQTLLAALRFFFHPPATSLLPELSAGARTCFSFCVGVGGYTGRGGLTNPTDACRF